MSDAATTDAEWDRLIDRLTAMWALGALAREVNRGS